MASVFCDTKRVLMVEFMQQATTTMSEMYCKTIKELLRVIQNKIHDMLTSNVVLLHDNVHLHTAADTQTC
jgi:hypothetical protein